MNIIRFFIITPDPALYTRWCFCVRSAILFPLWLQSIVFLSFDQLVSSINSGIDRDSNLYGGSEIASMSLEICFPGCDSPQPSSRLYFRDASLPLWIIAYLQFSHLFFLCLHLTCLIAKWLPVNSALTMRSMRFSPGMPVSWMIELQG